MIPYLARLLEVTVNNVTIPNDRKRATLVPIYTGGGGLIGFHKLQTTQLYLCGMEARGTHHSRMPKACLRYKHMVIRRAAWI
jgi:hypothetical protein